MSKTEILKRREPLSAEEKEQMLALEYDRRAAQCAYYDASRAATAAVQAKNQAKKRYDKLCLEWLALAERDNVQI